MKKLVRSCGLFALVVFVLAAQQSQAQYYVARKPTHVSVVPPPMPKAGYVWTPDEWRWVDGRYIWISGRWLRPPYGGATWIPGVWRKTPHGYYWVAGKWGQRL